MAQRLHAALRVGSEFIPPAAVSHFRAAYRELAAGSRHELLAEIGTMSLRGEGDAAELFSALLDARRGAEDVDGTSGMGFLIDVRADALAAKQHGEAVGHVDGALRGLLSAWVHPGHLRLERVTWSSSAALCERVAKYERVHPSRNLSDLRARLGDGRRCYALVHPAMPDVPLVMIHCALLDEIPSSLQDVHTRSTEDHPRCAAFWSISSTQDGLRGIDLGHALIKRAVSELRTDFQSLEHFSTLSPIPGFMPWLRALGDGDSGDGDSAIGALRAALDDAGVMSAALQVRLLCVPLHFVRILLTI